MSRSFQASQQWERIQRNWVTEDAAADLTGFNGEEIAMVDSVISLFWGLSARQVSEISHEFDGWKLAEYKETIPYDMALLSDREPTEEDLALAMELGREYAAYTA